MGLSGAEGREGAEFGILSGNFNLLSLNRLRDLGAFGVGQDRPAESGFQQPFGAGVAVDSYIAMLGRPLKELAPLLKQELFLFRP